MATILHLPHGAVPTNLHLRESVQTRIVDRDLYDICERVREISPDLYIIEMREGGDHAFAIMERCSDGVERLVFKVRELDNRVLEKLRYLMAKPLQERLDEIDRDDRRHKEQEHEAELDRLYETLGGPMLRQLDRDGFLGTTRGTSYAKGGSAARRARRS